MDALNAPAVVRAAPVRRGGGAALGLGPGFGITVLVIAALYFTVPMLAAAIFSFQGTGGRPSQQAYQQAFSEPQLWPALALSLEVAAGTIVLTLALLVPTVIWVNLRLPHLRRLMESLTLLPLATPPVVLVLGILVAFHGLPNLIVGTPVILVLEYVVLVLPYSYRILDSGVQAIDLHTMVDASRSLGSNWGQVLRRVLLPNLQGSLLSASFITLALVLGEFVVASLLTFNTFPVFLDQVGQDRAGEAVALSTFALAFTWAALLAISLLSGWRRRGRRSQMGGTT